MKAIICGGGTAGHVTPGIAVAETILMHQPGSDILFIGREGGNENRLVDAHKLKMSTIEIKGFSRKSVVKNFKNAVVAIKALRRSKQIIDEFKPDIVIGTGGYVCWPVLRAAQGRKIPTMIHESNVVPGLTTKLLYSKCYRTLLNFPGSESQFKKKENLIVVGNPILASLKSETRDSARRKLGISKNDFVILSFGGSGGAELLNKNVIDLMMNYSAKRARIKHIHACGKKYYEAIEKVYPTLTAGRSGCKIYAFIDNMPLYLRAADIAICRCGAMTLSEVAASGVVPILIPSPNVTDNHQYKNGRLFSDAGAGIMIEEHDLSERRLLDAVRSLESDKEFYKSTQNALKSFSITNSNELIWREIQKALPK